MKDYFNYNKNTMFNKWSLVIVALCLVVAIAVCSVVLPPRAEASEANIYVEGRLVSNLHLADDYNPVAIYNGVMVQVAAGKVQTIWNGATVTLNKASSRIVYPTLGIVVELA